MRFRYKRMLFVLLIPLGYLLMQLSENFPQYVEDLFSQSIYPVLAQGISTVTGLLPFSLAEVVLYLLAFTVVVSIGYGVYVFFKNIRHYKDYMLSLFSNVIVAVSLVYFVFVFICGFNYNRYSFAHFAQLDVQPRQVSELADTTQYLMREASSLRDHVSLDATGRFTLPYSFEEAAEIAALGMDNLSHEYPILRGIYSPAKAIRTSSQIMSELNLCGFFFPFTFEANVNADIPSSELGYTLCHEMAHVRGFMKEDDANFISYLACLATEDTDFMYAGTLHSLIHCMNALYKADPALHSQIIAELDAKVAGDIRGLSGYWLPYNGAASKLSDKVNNTYLKVNNQVAGIESYGNTVDTLISYYKLISVSSQEK